MTNGFKGYIAVFGVLQLLILTGALAFVYSAYRTVIQTGAWPTTEGRVLASTAATAAESPPAWPYVTYEYRVGGERYVGSKVHSDWTDSSIAEYLSQYPVGSDVTVHYDPDRPYLAVLDTSTSETTGTLVFFGIWWAGTAALLAGLAVNEFLGSTRSRRRAFTSLTPQPQAPRE
jgi:hypothetical protein